MKRLLLLSLLLGAAPAAAQERHAPECPDKKVRPRFTGHPFKPFDCPKPGEPAQAEVALSSASLPSPKDRSKANLKPFEGRWEGLVSFGMSRFELLLQLDKKGGDYKGRAWFKDYHFHIRHELDGLLDAPFFAKAGRYSVVLESPTVPGSKLKGDAWLGAPAAPSEDPLLDRELIWRLDGRPEIHRLKLGLNAGRLRFVYVMEGPGGALSRAAGELSRSSRESL